MFKGKIIENIAEDYINSNLSLVKILKKHGISKTQFYRVLRHLKVNYRREIGSGGRKYHCNFAYFSNIDSEDVAYWLGFIAADGCVCSTDNSLVISLAVKDYQHLVKFNDSLASNYPIFLTSNGAYTVRVHHPQIKKDLAKQSILPRKTGNTLFSPVPQEYISHYIRGIFDGDGCLTSNKNNYNSLSFSIAGSCDFLLKIQDILILHCGLSKVKLHKCKNRNCYILHYCGTNQVKRILKYIYKGANIYLDRKYLRAKPYLM